MLKNNVDAGDLDMMGAADASEEHDECESCGSDEHVVEGLCLDCAEDAEDWDMAGEEF